MRHARGAAALALGAALAGGQATAQMAAGTADLWLALRDGAEDTVILGLVLDGAALDGRDEAMRTPLHLAAAVSGDPELIGLMLERGADPAARDARGRTPLHDAAALNPALGVTAVLAVSGAPLDARAADGATALHGAARAGAWRAGALLVALGADPCALDASGRRAIDARMLEAARTGAPEAYPALRAAFLGCP